MLFGTEGYSWRFHSGNSAKATISSGGFLTTWDGIRINGNSNLYLDYNYGCSIVGVYASTRYQGIFAMGDSYKLPIDGTSPSNLYGLAWSHPNAGGQAGYLDSHGLLIMVNGLTYAAISNSIWARGNINANGYLSAQTDVYLGAGSSGQVRLSTYNNRNFQIIGTGGSDVGILATRNGSTSFGFQIYSDGSSYGFLNYAWGAWNLRKNISGALYMNDNNSYYINTTGDSSLGGNLYVARHYDASSTWGNCGCVSVFLGWNGSKVVLGNNANGGHDYANNLGSNTVVSTNNFYCYLDITAYSDKRVKENVEVIEDAVEKVKAIRGVTFTRNDVEDKEKRHAGVIAQEVLEVLPEVVSEDTQGHYSVAYGNLTSLLIEAIKEQQVQIEVLTQKITELENK